jgi:hypothetical protein
VYTPRAVTRWADLEARADLPEVQAIIRGEIARGTIRVSAAPGGGIRIIPTGRREPPVVTKVYAKLDRAKAAEVMDRIR